MLSYLTGEMFHGGTNESLDPPIYLEKYQIPCIMVQSNYTGDRDEYSNGYGFYPIKHKLYVWIDSLGPAISSHLPHWWEVKGGNTSLVRQEHDRRNCCRYNTAV